MSSRMHAYRQAGSPTPQRSASSQQHNDTVIISTLPIVDGRAPEVQSCRSEPNCVPGATQFVHPGTSRRKRGRAAQSLAAAPAKMSSAYQARKTCKASTESLTGTQSNEAATAARQKGGMRAFFKPVAKTATVPRSREAQGASPLRVCLVMPAEPSSVCI
jgi:hypothetical protein